MLLTLKGYMCSCSQLEVNGSQAVPQGISLPQTMRQMSNPLLRCTISSVGNHLPFAACSQSVPVPATLQNVMTHMPKGGQLNRLAASAVLLFTSFIQRPICE